MATRYVCPFNEQKGILLANGQGSELILYALDGRPQQKINSPQGMVGGIGYLDNNLLAGFYSNYTGDEEKKIALFSYDGKVIKTFPNYLQAQKSNAINCISTEGWFYNWKRKLYFKELFNDTLFYITINSIIPRFAFYCGKFSLPYEKKNIFDFKDLERYYLIENIYETNKYIFFYSKIGNNSYLSVYDKFNNKCIISNMDTDGGSGFLNDIDSFIPLGFSSVNIKEELIGILEPYEIIKWFKDNPDKASKLPSRLQKLKNLEETDNPVIVIAKTKD